MIHNLKSQMETEIIIENSWRLCSQDEELKKKVKELSLEIIKRIDDYATENKIIAAVVMASVDAARQFVTMKYTEIAKKKMKRDMEKS